MHQVAYIAAYAFTIASTLTLAAFVLYALWLPFFNEPDDSSSYRVPKYPPLDEDGWEKYGEPPDEDPPKYEAGFPDGFGFRDP